MQAHILSIYKNKTKISVFFSFIPNLALLDSFIPLYNIKEAETHIPLPVQFSISPPPSPPEHIIYVFLIIIFNDYLDSIVYCMAVEIVNNY